MFLKKILSESTDREHGITMQEIIDELAKYGINSERKSLYDDLRLLGETGVKIKGDKTNNEYRYHVEKREFELAELKLLVDAIQSSRFVTERKSRELIGKLEGLCSKYEGGKLQRQVFVTGRIKTMNESVYNIIDSIHSAIGSNMMIKFKYGSWNIKKELQLKKGGAFYIISPWALVWSNDYYYMIGYDDAAGMIKHYRVDKMSCVGITGDLRKGRELFEGISLADYTIKNISMFEGEEKTVTVEIDNALIGVFIDKFGKDEVTVISAGGGCSHIRFRVNVNSQFLGFIFSLGKQAKIIGPGSVVKQARDMISGLYGQYSDQ